MSGTLSEYVSVTRTFRDLSDIEIADIEKTSSASRMAWSKGVGWDEVLKSPRVLLVSEAGAGKTRECQAQRDRLLLTGKSAFFFDLATLATTPLKDTLLPDEEIRFDTWYTSQSDIATFFLDSIDELKLTLGSFDQAVKRFARALTGQLGRARIVVTTRPVPFDRALIQRYLPAPSPAQVIPTAEAFADMIMERGETTGKREETNDVRVWRTVGLMPLSYEQRRLFALGQGIQDPDALLNDIQARDAEEFAERPQDLIELCADWRDHQRIRSHRDQVETNILNKLKPRIDRPEGIELTHEAAIEGASRLALAAMLTRRLTLRYNAESDRVIASEPALDVSKILLDWNSASQATLLERPLFGFASYGRVRFHHRSVVEFLAAKRLDTLLERGAPIKGIKRLLFTETVQGLKIVRPSMRPVAAWLASWRATIFDDLVRLDAAVVLDHGDPQSLSIAQRTRALDAYVDRHGVGGWRGLKTPSIQVHRFAAVELGDSVLRLWKQGIENSEIRELLLRLIIAAKLRECADIAFDTAMDSTSPQNERGLAIEVLLRLSDARLYALSASIENDVSRWPPMIARRAMIDLIPNYMPLERLEKIVTRTPEKSSGLSDYGYRLEYTVLQNKFPSDYLDGMRRVFTEIINKNLSWNETFPHVRTDRPDLTPALSAVCCRQVSEGILTEAWMKSSLLVVRLSKKEYDEEKPAQQLRRALGNLPASTREIGFRSEAAQLDILHPMTDAYERLFELTHEKGITLADSTDASWVRRSLTDPTEELSYRKMMLWAEMVFLNRGTSNYQDFLNNLISLVADTPCLVAIVKGRLTTSDNAIQIRDWENRYAKDREKEKKKRLKARSSWITFWREIETYPSSVFHPNRADNTAWSLWQAMERTGHESRASGWNRLLIEQQFGKEIADQLRATLMTAWRKDRPTLASERPQSERNSFLVRWQFGLAGIVAEAEDPGCAKQLTEGEAELACRYVPLHLNGFPPWLESLAVQHPVAIDRVLGHELIVK